MQYRYTGKEYKILLDNMVILIDTREQENKHIINYFDNNNIEYEIKKLDIGDYNFKIKTNHLGFPRDTYFTDTLVIERKANLSELSGNLTDTSGRFLKELGRLANIPHCHLLIEDNSLDDIIYGVYDSKMNAISFLRTMLTIQRKYKIDTKFINKENTGMIIYELCKNELDNYIWKG